MINVHPNPYLEVHQTQTLTVKLQTSSFHLGLTGGFVEFIKTEREPKNYLHF